MQNQRTKKEINKTKFQHNNTSKLVYFQTFFINVRLHLIAQFDTKDTYVCLSDSQFKLVWSGQIKQKISCICFCERANILYAGTEKGTVSIIYLADTQAKQPQKIAAINGQNILAMFSCYNQKEKVPQLIAINAQGILRKYRNNKYETSISFPFKLVYATSNKTITDIKDVAVVFFKQNGRRPYLFSAQFLLQLFCRKFTKQQFQSKIVQYEKSFSYEKDQQILTQNITSVALSNSKDVIAIATETVVTICILIRVGQWIVCLPDFKFVQQEKVLSLDLVQTGLVMCSQKGIVTFDIERRKKIANGLVLKNGQYNFAKWGELFDSIVFGIVGGKKGRITHCQLNLIAHNEEQSKTK